MNFTASMRMTIRGLSLTTALLSGAAHAADAAGSYPSPASGFSWACLHACLNVGGGFGAQDGTTFDSDWWKRNDDHRTLIYAAQAGYDWQITPLFVAGIENDVEFVGGNASN